MRSCKLVIVEGIIGVGKSEFSQELAKELGALVIHEADQEHADSFHDEFYEDMVSGENRNHAFLLQIDQLTRRAIQHQLAQFHVLSGGSAVLDRSFFGDTCFARMLHSSGALPDKQYACYTRLFRLLSSGVMLPNVMVRLSIAPQHAMERIQKRARELPKRAAEASSVTLEYQIALNREVAHLARTMQSQGVHVLEVPWDVERETKGQRKRAVQAVASSIRELPAEDPILRAWKRVP